MQSDYEELLFRTETEWLTKPPDNRGAVGLSQEGPLGQLPLNVMLILILSSCL